MKFKNRYKIAVRVLIGLLVAYLTGKLFLAQIELTELVKEARCFSPVRILMAMPLAVFALYLRAMRWKLILGDQVKLHTLELFKYTTIGFMVNNILPAKIGESVRPLLLWKNTEFSLGSAVSSLMLERIIDLFVVSIWFLLPVYLLPQLDPYKTASLYLIAVPLLILSVLAYAKRKNSESMTGLSRITWLKKLFAHISPNLNWTTSVNKTLAVVALSFLCWICYPLIILVLMKGRITLGLMGACFAHAWATFGALIPSAPGSFGTLHYFMQKGMNIMGIPEKQTISLVIIYHLVVYVGVNLVGLVCYYNIGTRLRLTQLYKAKVDL